MNIKNQNTNSDDKNLFEVAHEIVELIKDKDIDVSNLDNLQEFATNNQFADELFSKLSDSKYVADALCNFKESYKKDRATEIFNLINKRRKIIQRRERIVRVMTSCAVALLVVTFTFYIKTNMLNNRAKDSITNISPTKTTSAPILILANGVKIDLNNISSTLPQKNIILNKETKTIEYKKDSVGINSDTLIYNKLIIPKLSTYNIILSDGTKVMLNAGSSFEYPSEFTKGKREVFLSGEAFFDVTKSNKQFVVNTKHVDINVFGTSFNLKADKCTEAVLIDGKITAKIKTNNIQTEIEIAPNEQFCFEEESGKIELNKVDVSQYIAWMDNYFMGSNVSLGYFLEQISNWYGIIINCPEEYAENNYVTISIKRDMSVIDIMQAIEKITNVKFVMEGGRYYTVTGK